VSSPRSFDGLIARHAAVAVELSGADRTRWNGRLDPTDNGVLGGARWDGSLEFDRKLVVQPLREMYERAGVRHPPKTLRRYREALLTLLHEQSHFLGPHNGTPQTARLAFKRAGSRALEEGVAEAWTHDNADRFLRRLGVPRIAPGIMRVRTDPGYPEFLPAVRALATGIGSQVDLPPATVLDLLNRHTAETQWATITELLYRSSEFARLVPPDEEQVVKFSLEEAGRWRFAELDALERFAPGSQGRAAAIGRATLRQLQTEIAKQAARWRPTSSTAGRTAQAQVPSPAPGSGPAESSTTAEPSVAAHLPAAARLPAAASGPSRSDGSSQRGDTALALRRALSGQQSAAPGLRPDGTAVAAPGASRRAARKSASLQATRDD
jgi:hypothetical protein